MGDMATVPAPSSTLPAKRGSASGDLQKHAEQVRTMRACIESAGSADQVREHLQTSDFYARTVSIVKSAMLADPATTVAALDLLLAVLDMSRDHIPLFFKRCRSGIDVLARVLVDCANRPSPCIRHVVPVLNTLCAQSLASFWDVHDLHPPDPDLDLDLARLVASIVTRDDLDGHIATLLMSDAVVSTLSCGLIRSCGSLVGEYERTGRVSDPGASASSTFAAALCAIAAAKPDAWPLINLMQSNGSICTIMDAIDVAGSAGRVEAHARLIVLLGFMEIDADSIGKAEVRETLERFVRLETCCREMWAAPGNDDVVSASLNELSEMLAAPLFGEVAICIPDIVKLLINCLGNIDEMVMVPALNATYLFLLACPDAQQQFLDRGGFDALAECLHDYNVEIRVTSMEILSIVAARHPENRSMLQSSGIVKYILELIGQFGRDDDVGVQIVEAGAGVLGLALTETPANQEYMSDHDGVSILLSTIRACIAGEGDIAQTTIDALLLALNNLVYRNRRAQEEFRKHGGFEVAFRLWNDDDDALLASVLNLLVNAIDTCEPNQEMVCTAAFQARMTSLLDGGHAAISCVLLSHATWNHERNQALFSTEAVVELLLKHVASNAKQDQLSLFALMALSNLSYQNSALQDLVAKFDGVAVVHEALVRATQQGDAVTYGAITTALGNVVHRHDVNGTALVGLGGVDLLLTYITDNDDDDTSEFGALGSSAFLTIVQMGETSLTHILQVLKTGKAPAVTGNACAGAPDDGMDPLIPYLTALNGIIYLSPAMAEFVIRSEGLATIVGLLRHESKRALAGYILFILVNLTVSQQKPVQARARSEGAFDALESCLRWLGAGEPDDDDAAFSRGEIRRVIYQVLDNLLTGNTSNTREFLSRTLMIETLLSDCGELTGARRNATALPEAAEVLLTLCEQPRATDAIGVDRVRPLLEIIQQRTSSQTMHDKAQHLLQQISGRRH
ncbi:hypothetical protein PBRA_000633 [Plasmodiophora brassicae]|uniref:Uncharacterized protein n=1 Tax=Plasmodiophora brassicae TaxID=37360 RepID=A0A0G4IPM3_PLABS|nr:hypothetical protein PBRA_000633 [Plasmodiophora brassicae]